MSNGLVSHSPKRSGRSRLSEFLKPSPPTSRPVSPGKALQQPLSNGHVSKAGDVSSWPLVTAKDVSPDPRSPLGVKSKGNEVEVVVGASPMKENGPNTPQYKQSAGFRDMQRRFSRATPTKADVPLTVRDTTPNPPTPRKEKEVDDGNKPGSLQRSASDLNLPDTRGRADTTTSTDSRPSIRSAVSEIGLATMNNGVELARPQAVAVTKDTKVSRRQSITNRLRSRSKPQPVNLKLSDSGSDLAKLPKAILSPKEQIANPIDNANGPKSRRTTWIIGSRSPSPSNRKLLQHKRSLEKFSLRSKSYTDESNALQKSQSETMVQRPSLTPTDTSGTKKSKRPLSAIIQRSNTFVGGGKPTISLPKSMSMERLPVSSPIDEVPEMPKSIPRSRLQAGATETPKKKDELYQAFRGLDAEHTKFISKASSLRAQVVRAGLLPFLKGHADHPSTKTLRAEDLDRRINILNKWWTSLLEMLNGRNGQSVAPNDRPAVLEAVSGIMQRPEWRLSLTTISRTPSKLAISRSVSSLESASSDFLAESVLHNVRNTFIQNLLSQMAFVVERMSARTVPASIVTFCGKACAYAFFFCPGVAEILVRLWSPSPDAIKRTLKEAGAMNQDYDPAFAVDVLSQNFPAHLQPFKARSCISLLRYLRNKPKDTISANSAYIPWNGPWVARWCGRDSDLFFVFVKTAFVLICELLPETTSLADWASVPCTALIQAQILSVMDATMHRGSSSQDPSEGLPPPSFDDVLGADAVVQPLPRAPNTVRIMAENRLIMLLRECLFSATFSGKDYTRRVFAQVYTNVLKAATRRVSLFDHSAYFTLCDFLEEAFVILARFHKDDEDTGRWLDWDFWFDVLKKMGNTENTMSEVRLYTFVYGMWGTLAQSDDRRRDMCLGWLLQQDYFDKHFNHWCPMVRAYYMRLLCWRMARADGESSELSILIYKTFFERMNTSWSWFLAMQALARASDTVGLSTAPATPAPGRKLLIVRNDSGPATGGQMSWDTMMAAASSSASPNTYQRYSSLNPVMQAASPTTSNSPGRTPSPKKSWLRKMNPFATPSPSKPSPSDSDTDSISSKHEDSKVVASSSTNSKRMSTMSIVNSPSEARGRIVANGSPRPAVVASFKFSLEWTDKASLALKDRKLAPPRLPQLSQQVVDLDLFKEGKIDAVIQPCKPRGAQIGPSKYCGRALAEWEILVRECQSFYDRRRAEGVTDIKWMETPTLGVESFRRPIG